MKNRPNFSHRYFSIQTFLNRIVKHLLFHLLVIYYKYRQSPFYPYVIRIIIAARKNQSFPQKARIIAGRKPR
ncbi:hypothetical protein [Arcticibacter sp. MXS-1]|uniref:hypothetical protein n=1 Tax=Arcticibacter sp. MXS-1 TaxID=3341726 RepID=UPI0035A8F23E